MSARLHRVVYVSRWSNVLGEDGEAALHRIVAGSVGRNRERDITGLLVAHEGWFLQALEGPDTEISALMARIMLDPRHRNVRILGVTAVDVRLFQDWNMAGARLGPDAGPLLVELGQIAHFDGHGLDAKGALILLEFAAEARRKRERADVRSHTG